MTDSGNFSPLSPRKTGAQEQDDTISERPRSLSLSSPSKPRIGSPAKYRKDSLKRAEKHDGGKRKSLDRGSPMKKSVAESERSSRPRSPKRKVQPIPKINPDKSPYYTDAATLKSLSESVGSDSRKRKGSSTPRKTKESNKSNKTKERKSKSYEPNSTSKDNPPHRVQPTDDENEVPAHQANNDIDTVRAQSPREMMDNSPRSGNFPEHFLEAHRKRAISANRGKSSRKGNTGHLQKTSPKQDGTVPERPRSPKRKGQPTPKPNPKRSPCYTDAATRKSLSESLGFDSRKRRGSSTRNKSKKTKESNESKKTKESNKLKKTKKRKSQSYEPNATSKDSPLHRVQPTDDENEAPVYRAINDIATVRAQSSPEIMDNSPRSGNFPEHFLEAHLKRAISADRGKSSGKGNTGHLQKTSPQRSQEGIGKGSSYIPPHTIGKGSPRTTPQRPEKSPHTLKKGSLKKKTEGSSKIKTDDKSPRSQTGSRKRFSKGIGKQGKKEKKKSAKADVTPPREEESEEIDMDCLQRDDDAVKEQEKRLAEFQSSPFDLTEEEKAAGEEDYKEKMDAINLADKWDRGVLSRPIARLFLPKVTQSPGHKENQRQAMAGFNLLDKITTKPLSWFWDKLTFVLPIILFIIGLIWGIIDMALSPEYLDYKVPATLLAVTEIIIVGILLLMKLLPFYQRKTEEQKASFDKKRQVVENLVAELLLYPSIVVSTVGVTADKDFMPDEFSERDNHGGRLDIFLLTFDLVAFVYVYAARIHIVRRFVSQIESAAPHLLGADKSGCGCNVATRLIAAIALNFVSYLCMLVLLGATLYQENYDSSRPTMGLASGYMMAAGLVLPALGIATFAMASYYWLLELMVKLNGWVGESKEFRKKLREDLGEASAGAVRFAAENIHVTPGRLHDIRSLSPTKKVFFVMREWWIDIFLLAWAAVILLYAYIVFDKQSQVNDLSGWGSFSNFYLALTLITLCVFVAANAHGFLLIGAVILASVPLTFTFGAQAIVDVTKRKMKESKTRTVDDSQASKSPNGHVANNGSGEECAPVCIMNDGEKPGPSEIYTEPPEDVTKSRSSHRKSDSLQWKSNSSRRKPSSSPRRENVHFSTPKKKPITNGSPAKPHRATSGSSVSSPETNRKNSRSSQKSTLPTANSPIMSPRKSPQSPKRVSSSKKIGKVTTSTEGKANVARSVDKPRNDKPRLSVECSHSSGNKRVSSVDILRVSVERPPSSQHSSSNRASIEGVEFVCDEVFEAEAGSGTPPAGVKDNDKSVLMAILGKKTAQVSPSNSETN